LAVLGVRLFNGHFLNVAIYLFLELQLYFLVPHDDLSFIRIVFDPKILGEAQQWESWQYLCSQNDSFFIVLIAAFDFDRASSYRFNLLLILQVQCNHDGLITSFFKEDKTNRAFHSECIGVYSNGKCCNNR
jgi:hypothetical protein